MDTLENYSAAMLAERAGVGAAVLAAPGSLLTTFGAPASMDNPAVRYTARLFGIRNVALGLQVWDARHDPERLRRLATMNAAIELTDAVAGAVIVARVPEMRRPGIAVVLTSLAVATGFLGLRTVAGRRCG